MSDAGSLAALLVTLAAATVVPFYWLSVGSWLSVVGAFLLATDIAVAVAVGKPLLRFLRGRLHLPEWILGVPLIPAVALTVGVVNVLATFAAVRLLPASLFPS